MELVRSVGIAFRGLAALSIASGVGLVVGLLTCGLYAVLPSHAVVGPLPSGLYGETVRFNSSSGSLLHGWWLPSRQSGGGAVILIHGAWSNRLEMAERAHQLVADGFSVLLFDLQAHGESSGSFISFGKLEALDAEAAVSFIHSKVPDEAIGVIGFSLGAAAAVLGSRPLDVQAIVLESIYRDIDTNILGWLRLSVGPMIAPLVSPLAKFILHRALLPAFGFSSEDLSPIEHIATAKAPLLFLTGSSDIFVSPEETQAIFQRAPEPKSLWSVQGAAHVDLEEYARVQYWTHVMPFLSLYLRKQRSVASSESMFPVFMSAQQTKP